MQLRKAFQRFMLAAILGLIGAALVQPSQSSAQELDWEVKSNTPYRVQIAFYSRTFNRQWGPGGGKVWGLNDYEFHSMRLNCTPGEKICFGAWKTGDAKTYWGVGFGGKQGCSACCYTCGQKTRRQELNP